MAVWGGMAIRYRFPGPESVRMLIGATFALLGLVALFARLWTGRNSTLAPFLLAFALLAGWWNSLKPPAVGDWSPDVARQVTGQIDGDILTLTNVRNFEWHDDGSFTANWNRQAYDLNDLATVDLFLSYWAGPSMAHFILSFAFEAGQYLAWSIEVRREVAGSFSPVADLFKANPIVIVAANERDVVGLRTNIRRENVQLFRLKPDKKTARNLLEEYVRDANALAEAPEWYNSITTNCTTVVLKMMQAIGDGLPLDWRIIVNGYLPEFGYDRGALNTEYSIAELRRLGSVSSKGQSFSLKPGYSEAIRDGVPRP